MNIVIIAGKAIAANPALQQALVLIGKNAWLWLCECAEAAEQEREPVLVFTPYEKKEISA